MAISIPIIAEWAGSNAISKAKREFQQLEGVGTKAAFAIRKAAIPATAAIGAIGYALFNATKAAIEDAAAQDLLANNLRKTTGATDTQIAAVEDWIATQGRLLGISDDQLRPVLSRLAKATGSVSKAQKLATQSMDIAAATGKPLATVVQAVERAYGGNLTALARLAPEYRQMIKDGASFEQVMAEIAKTTGGAASEAANTTAGRMQRLGVAFDEIKETIGTAFLPVAEKLATFLTEKFLPAFDKFAQLIKEEGFVEAFQELGKKLWSWIQPQIKPMLKKLGEFIAAAAKWLWYVGIPKIARELDKLGLKFIEWIGPRILPMIEKLGELIGAMVYWLITEGIPKLAKLAVNFGIAFAQWFVDAVPVIVVALGKAFVEIGKKAASAALQLGKELAKSIGKGLVNGVIAVLNLLIKQINDALEFTIPVPMAPDIKVNAPNIPSIPYLAEGGIVNKPTLSVVGEAGPEAVIPLDRLNEFGGGVNIHVTTGVGDPVAIGREVARVMEAYSRRAGRAA